MMTREEFATITQVDGECLQRLTVYADLLQRWNPKINLVGPTTLPDLWRRHMLDSAQLFPLIPKSTSRLVDMGSGAGFPAMVLAIMGVPGVHLIESDGRKAAFLNEVRRATGAVCTIHPRRVDEVEPMIADVITARALAPLSQLLQLAQPFIGPETICLFPKGKNAKQELTDSHKMWKMNVEIINSLSDASGSILKLKGVARHGLDNR